MGLLKGGERGLTTVTVERATVTVTGAQAAPLPCAEFPDPLEPSVGTAETVM